MHRYGQPITWGTATAPHPFKGICTSYSYNEQYDRQLDEDEAGDYRAAIQHSHKASVSFDAKVIVDADAGSADFLDLSAGAAVTVAGLNTGVVLASRAVERWSLGQSKTISFQGTHYPDITQVTPAAAGALDAQTPDQSGIATPILLPGQNLIWSTRGFTSTAGLIQSLEISQELQLTEDDPDPTGVIKGCTAHGYLRTISLDALFRTGDTAPAAGAVLNLTATGAMTNIADYRVESAEKKFSEKRGMMYSIRALWIPPFTS